VDGQPAAARVNLRAHVEAAGRYASFKARAARESSTLASYPEAKAGIVDQLLAEARSEFDGR